MLDHFERAMKIYWSSKQIPELSQSTWRERNIALRRFRGFMMRVRVTPLGAAAWFVLVGVLWGSAFLSSFFPDVPGACVLAVGGIGAFYLHHVLILTAMSRCLERGEFRFV